MHRKKNLDRTQIYDRSQVNRSDLSVGHESFSMHTSDSGYDGRIQEINWDQFHNMNRI